MMRRRILTTLLALLVAALVGGALAGCGTGEEPAPAGGEGSAPTLESADPGSMGPEEFAEVVAEPDTVVLDVRTPEEYAEGHLPDAVNIDATADDFDERLGELDPEATYAVYCRTGNRSADAVRQMLGMGFDSIAHLDGGFVDWESAGLPTVE